MNIGIVGLGQITECHRDGYRRQGLRVVAGYDPSADARQRFAGQDPQAVVHLTLEALIDDASVQVIDLATPQWLDARLPCVEAAAAAGKPLLIQKPLAHTYDDALKLVQVIEDAGVPAMVNQNLCFVGGVQEAARAMLEDNAIGRPYLGYVVEQSCFDVAPDHWFGKGDRWWITNLTIHPLSVLHLLLGPPQSVDAVTGRDPSQPGVEAEGFVQLLLRYPVETFGGPLYGRFVTSAVDELTVRGAIPATGDEHEPAAGRRQPSGVGRAETRRGARHERRSFNPHRTPPLP